MKKLVCILLSLITFLSSCVISVYAESREKTKKEAMMWARSQIGQSIDFDKQNGPQCVDLIMAYYDFLGEKRGKGNAVDYVRNSIPDGWERIKDAKPKMGDVLIYSGEPDVYYGHLGIYESINSSYHQANGIVYNTTKPYYSITSSRGAPYWGVIRPVFSDEKENENVSSMTVTRFNGFYEDSGSTETASKKETINVSQTESSSNECNKSNITLLKPFIKSITITENRIRLSWSNNKNIDGYQVKYSTSNKFKLSYSKTKIVKNKNKCIIKNLKSNRTYYVKVRAYKKIGKKVYYSKWSDKDIIKL